MLNTYEHTTDRPDRSRQPDRPFDRTLRGWLPLLLAAGWMLATFGMFWTGGMASEVPNPLRLTGFVLAATGAFALGYAIRIGRRRRPRQVSAVGRTASRRRITRLVVAGAIYHIALGLALLGEYGATGPASIWASLQDPAGAYVSKFAVYEQQQDAGRVNPAIQMLTLLGVLGTVLVPLLVVHWSRLSRATRFIGVTGMATYGLFFLFIGTLKGLGDIAIMVGGGLLVTSATVVRRTSRVERAKRRRLLALAGTIGILFCGYMVTSQADRIDRFGIQDRVPPNRTVEAVAGTHLATGVAALVHYPTHGYLGLAYNLETPFEWSHGLGSTPAVASYAQQYFGTDIAEYPSYPVRTESRTGWPAGLYWSTIYPWLASDLTYPGVVVFMAALGWLFAATWVGAVQARRTLPLLLFVQLCVLVAYIPANNQLGMSRPSMIGLVALAGWWLATQVAAVDAGLRDVGPQPWVLTQAAGRAERPGRPPIGGTQPGPATKTGPLPW
ncbi:hypothetical protein [Micromonospora sp. NPDC005174]|uniref:hypothetical protein n=1 Tax=Micromonospora sp. NPDC005174 TaxID=3157018 RepID=UPI0033A077EE